MKKTVRRAVALTLALALVCSGCGGTRAATMFLRKTEGAVGVTDSEGQDVAPAESLGLYSGYAVDTQNASFAWIDLDRAKLVKMDERSHISIVQEEKALTVEVVSGRLFFHVTEPLAEDETMEIRSSTLLVGIRGTCGWVDVPDARHMNVYLLEGAVECAAGENTASVRAGEMAALTADGEITVSEFDVTAVPAFVAGELAADEALNDAVREASGLDAAAYDPAAFDALLASLENVAYTELADFNADGSPELLAVDTGAGETMPRISVYEATPDGPRLRLRQDLYFADSNGIYTWSLMEWDGRLYLCRSEDFVDHFWYRYMGPAPAQEEDGRRWGDTDLLGYDEKGMAAEYAVDFITFIAPHDASGLLLGGDYAYYPGDRTQFDAVRGRYTLVHDILQAQNGVLTILAP